MLLKKFIDWMSLVLFVVAAVILAILVLLVFSPPLAKLVVVNPQAVIVVSGVLALAAAVFGFYTFKTAPGRVGAIGGLVLFIVIACLLSFTTVAQIRGNDARQASPSLSESARVGEVTLEPCLVETKSGRLDSDCGTLVVPENRTRIDSRLIVLPVIRIHATSEIPAEPIFWLEGGPGMSNIKFKPPASLLANHDFVMVGYRGVDGSVVLGCPQVSGALGGFGGDLLSKESLAHLGATEVQCARRLQAQGVDLGGYTIPEVVADLEVARAGLGYERVNLLSQSYGTRIAQIYAYLNPDRVYRSVMIGVNPPGHFVWEPGTVDAQLKYYAHLCARDTECRARTPDLAESIRNVAHNMPERWLFLPIDPGKVKAVTFAMLFQRNTAAMVFDAYLAAEAGDPSGLALMSAASNFVLPSLGTWGDFFSKGGTADYDPSRNYGAEMNPSDSILGSPISLLIWGSLPGNWPMDNIPAELRQAHFAEVETLLVSGSVDFSTPAEVATNELLPYLIRGKQVIVAEAGHVNDIWNLQPAATERLLTSFYDTGMADDSLYTYMPVDLSVLLGFPMMAKLGLGLVVLFIGAVVVAIGLVARRVRRRMVRRQQQGAA